MKIGTLTSTNQKGQIVIPQKIREELGIYPDSVLNLFQVGNGIYLYPVEEVLTRTEKESSYLEVLKMTKGSWSKEDFTSLRKKRKKTEIRASLIRKEKW